MDYYARLKPHNPALGCVLKQYGYKGHKYIQGQWTLVSPALGEELSTIFQRHDDPSSPLAFNIGTKKQMQTVLDKERELQERALRKFNRVLENDLDTAVKAKGVGGDLTTADIPKDAPKPKDTHIDLDDDEPEEKIEKAIPRDEDLGVSMLMKKAELSEYANGLGIDTENMTKAEIFDAIKQSLTNS